MYGINLNTKGDTSYIHIFICFIYFNYTRKGQQCQGEKRKMLRGQNDEQLMQKGVKEEVILFYQLWQELLNEKTLDIYQYRILTSLSALKELEEVLRKTIGGLFTNDANIESCREEVLHILDADMILDKNYKAIINRLRYGLGQKPKTDAEKIRLLALVKYSINKIESTYEKYAVEELKRSINERKNEDIVFYANIVASQAIHNGWSSQALCDLLRFFRDEKELDEQWKSFKDIILDTEKKCHDVMIHIPFRNQKNEDNLDTLEILERLGLNAYTYEQLTAEYHGIDDIGSLLSADKRYFRISVAAFDIYAAAHVAVRKISDLLNMASFFNLVSAWDLSSVSFVVVNDVNKYHKAFNAEQLYRTYDYLDSSSKVFDYTRSIFTDERRNVLKEKLTGAFGYANISRASLFQEEKYMNLWVALESLARTKMYPDIISNVKQTVPAAMSLRYIYRVVRNYIEDCFRCKVEFDFADAHIDMKQESKQRMVKEMIEVFRRPELYNVLLEKSKVNSLLRYRTETVHMILNNMEILKDKVKNHHDRIEWQIQRLYRIRNEIVHSALQNETSLIMYIEHLYDYLSIYITEIVTCMSERQEGMLEETLAVIKDNYDVFISFMDKKEYGLIEEKVIKTGVIDLV